MKTVSIEKAQTAVFDKYGAFSAFSNDQLNEKKKEGVEYSNLGAGLIAPAGTGTAIMAELDKLQKDKIGKELKLNTIKEIIWSSLANYECQIVGDYSDATAELEQYGVTVDQIEHEWSKYYDHCIANEYF